MAIVQCKCKGKNPNCEFCGGHGTYDNNTNLKPKAATDKAAAKKKGKLSFNPNDVEFLSKKDRETLVLEIIDLIDLKSKKQMQVLNSIPFRSETFKIDFADKLDELKTLEEAKQSLRNQLDLVIKEFTAKKLTLEIRFRHLLSNHLIDVSSTKQLKQLVREYKKLKAGK